MKRKICIFGLGYVGLPALVAFAEKGEVIGFDINKERIEQLKNGRDITHEVEKEQLLHPNITFTHHLEDVRKADFYIVTVPTPVDAKQRPDLSYLHSASKMIGSVLKKGDIVVYESTVYPGATEEDCLPLLEEVSGLKVMKDFGLGYSPERINPGDKEHTFTKIKKVISASDFKSLQVVEEVYGSVITAGLHLASSIKVAEAAKIIENIQRDVNISLMNELVAIFDRMNIDTYSVLEAASSKWNFLKFSPGLVGGHCIGVDPYYLTYKAQQLGIYPQVIASGRHVNNQMGSFIAIKTMEKLSQKGINPRTARISIFGFTFKENCPDTRNTKIIDIIHELNKHQIETQVHDEYALAEEVYEEYQIKLQQKEEMRPADALIIAVSHDAYKSFQLEDYQRFCKAGGVVIDVKNIAPKELLVQSGYTYWRP